MKNYVYGDGMIVHKHVLTCMFIITVVCRPTCTFSARLLTITQTGSANVQHVEPRSQTAMPRRVHKSTGPGRNHRT